MIATTIEQSRHLLELGLKAETADMYWERGYLDTHQESNDELRELTEPIDFNEHLLSLVPAWSFGALYLLLYRCGGTATDAPHLCEDVPGQGWYFRCYGMNYETISFPTMDNNLSFKAGAQWQKEQMITKACEWLKEHKEHPLIGCEDPCLSGYLTDEFIEDFKKAMEE